MRYVKKNFHYGIFDIPFSLFGIYFVFVGTLSSMPKVRGRHFEDSSHYWFYSGEWLYCFQLRTSITACCRYSAGRWVCFRYKEELVAFVRRCRFLIHSLRAYIIIQGTRGQKRVKEDKFAETIVRLSALLHFATEIKEMDINPFLAAQRAVITVDACIRIEK